MMVESPLTTDNPCVLKYDCLCVRVMAAKSRLNSVRGSTVHVAQLHFEDLSGSQFERLVFAYAVRSNRKNVEWIGQAGSDGGQDIRCEEKEGACVFLCANYFRLTFAKVVTDMRKLLKEKDSLAEIIVVSGGRVSAALRAKAKAEAKKLGFKSIQVWGAAEFEERVRKVAPDLLERFFGGEVFPSTPSKLRAAARAQTPATPSAGLSPDASQLLEALAASVRGTLLRANLHSGYSLTIEGKDFVADTMSGREEARWNEAIDLLLDLGLLRLDGGGGDNFAMTAAGYRALRPVASKPAVSAFVAKDLPDPASYFRNVEELIPEPPWGDGPLYVEIPQQSYAFLRLAPTAKVTPLKSALAAMHLASGGMLRPMGVDLGGADWVRNADGAFIYAGPYQQKLLMNFTQLFLTGEICGVDTTISGHSNAGASSSEILDVYRAELSIARALRNYTGFARNSLKYELPLRVVAGIRVAKGAKLGFGVRAAGRAVNTSVDWSGEIVTFEDAPMDVLREFFEQIWSVFGVHRTAEADKHLSAGLKN